MNKEKVMPQEFFAKLDWFKTGDAIYPFSNINDEDQEFKIRINDFPEEPMYTLLKEGVALCSFNEWPKQWTIK